MSGAGASRLPGPGQAEGPWGAERGISVPAAVLALLILTTIALIVAALVAVDSDAAATQQMSARALFIADGGVNHTVEGLQADWTYDPGGATSVPLAGGAFTADVVPPSQDPGLSGHEKRVDVTGTFGRAQRKLRVRVMRYPASFRFLAVVDNSTSGTVTIPNGADVTGSIYVRANVRVLAPSYTGTVYVPPGKSVTGGNGLTHPDPQPLFPTIDASLYDSLLAVAATRPPGDVTLGPSDVLDLSTLPDRTLYVNGNFGATGSTISGGSPSAPGRIVATGTLNLRANAQVGDGIQLVSAGSMSVQTAGTTVGATPMESGTLLYGRGGITLIAATVNGSLLTPADLTFRGVARGIIIAAGEVEIQGANFQGAFAAGRLRNDNFSTSTLTFTGDLPDGGIPGLTPAVVPGTWREV